MWAILRTHGGSRRRRRAKAFPAAEHSPLDLSAGGETAAKRARHSPSPSTRSDSDDRERSSNEGMSFHSIGCSVISSLKYYSIQDYINDKDV